MKKALSVVLAVIMMFTLGLSAFAAEANGTITVNNVVEGQTYSIYQIFSLESYDTELSAYSYKTTSAWADFAKSATTYVTVDKNDYVTWVDGADAAAFAKLALQYAEDNGIAATKTSDAVAAGQTSVSFTGLELGYYLVDSSLGALCILNTTDPDAEVNEKNDQPTIDKTVEEDKTGVYGDENDADMFQTVNYKTVITVQEGAENYVLHDKMDAGLTYGGDENVKVQVNGTNVDADNYTLTSTGLADSCTFEIAFDNDYVAGLAAGTEIVVSYTASLNEGAVIAGDGNVNETWLDYGDDNETTHDSTVTYTYEFDIIKTNSDNELLDGAEFKLYDAATNGNEIAVIYDDELGAYRLAKDGETSESIIIVEGGKAKVVGLDGDTTYYLEETVAPEGYNRLNGRVEVAIVDENLSASFEEDGTYVKDTGVQVVNKTGSELPSTGGMGTTIFTALGVVLVLGAGILLITKKRASVA